MCSRQVDLIKRHLSFKDEKEVSDMLAPRLPVRSVSAGSTGEKCDNSVATLASLPLLRKEPKQIRRLESSLLLKKDPLNCSHHFIVLVCISPKLVRSAAQVSIQWNMAPVPTWSRCPAKPSTIGVSMPVPLNLREISRKYEC